ncbi:hypothetical protein [Thalassomonas haliotis]|uniref:Uncharacterized protein n=1 Tax=Thalassomonas haliotis TaxID=485448 RepID=A0ABY7VAG4_9GAMM|nr:hypothetical protein [Thalassomonas haliotis]WDE10623.1 hypothetical protein H3N35_20540 [Thalassomonas haliotis]
MKTLTTSELMLVAGASSGQKGDDPKALTTPLQQAGALADKHFSQNKQPLTP